MGCRNRWVAKHTWNPVGPVPLRALLIFLLAVLLPSPGFAQQQETSLFKLTDVAGQVRLEYQYNGSDYSANTDSMATWEEEVALVGRGFVYHPAMLEFDLGGGPLLVQQQLDTLEGGASNSDLFWGGNLGLNLLKYKPYAFRVFIDRSHPTATTGLTGRFLTEANSRGISGKVDEGFIRLLPIQISWSANQYDRTGSGQGRLIDEDVQETRVSGVKIYRRKDKFRFDTRSETRVSGSGSLGLPIAYAKTETSNTRLYNNSYFGQRDQVSLNLMLSRLSQTQGESSPTVSSNYQANAGWVGEDNLKIEGGVKFNQTDREEYGVSTSDDQFLSLSGGQAGNDGFSYNAVLSAGNMDDPDFRQARRGGGGDLTYSRDFGVFRLFMNGGLSLENVDQETVNDVLPVFDEPVLLSGTLPSDLRNEYVDAASIEVTNVSGSQVFMEGLDYRLITVGATTSLERYIDGNIEDGETVLVSYQYQAGGTVDYERLGSRLSLRADLYKHLQLYVKHDEVEYALNSGVPSGALNNRTAIEVGGNLVGFNINRVSLGGSLKMRDQQEDISPFRNESASVFVSAPLPWQLNLRLSADVARVDYEFDEEDVDSTGYTLNLSGAFGRYGQLQYTATFRNNIGGSVPRENMTQLLRYNWQYRQVRLTANLTWVTESMGETQRASSSANVQLTRVF